MRYLVLQIKSFASYFRFKAPRLNDRKFARISLYERIFDRSTPGAFNLKIAVKTFDLKYLLILALFFAPLYGDIDSVTVKWSAQLCQPSCIKQLNERFSKMQGAEKVSIDGLNGVMNIKWKPK